eukprot:7760155-Pyramimonas_sp.AAC.2
MTEEAIEERNAVSAGGGCMGDGELRRSRGARGRGGEGGAGMMGRSSGLALHDMQWSAWESCRGPLRRWAYASGIPVQNR